jgi:uracil-DNA glycosylase
MALIDDAKALAHTLQALYGDLGDLPLLRETPAQRQKNDAAPSRSLASYAEEIRFCKKCVLHIGRSKLVFGRGSPQARVAFVGDFPSTKDDAAGEPFSDESGELLHKMIVAMKLKPEETYLTNIFKCRPPQNQVVDQDLFRACEAHLENQFEFLSAKFIVAMGEHSAKALARSESPLNVLRNQVFEWNGRRVFCTYHPRDLLSSPAKKKLAWEDLQAVMRELNR